MDPTPPKKVLVIRNSESQIDCAGILRQDHHAHDDSVVTVVTVGSPDADAVFAPAYCLRARKDDDMYDLVVIDQVVVNELYAIFGRRRSETGPVPAGETTKSVYDFVHTQYNRAKHGGFYIDRTDFVEWHARRVEYACALFSMMMCMVAPRGVLYVVTDKDNKSFCDGICNKLKTYAALDASTQTRELYYEMRTLMMIKRVPDVEFYKIAVAAGTRFHVSPGIGAVGAPHPCVVVTDNPHRMTDMYARLDRVALRLVVTPAVLRETYAHLREFHQLYFLSFVHLGWHVTDVPASSVVPVVPQLSVVCPHLAEKAETNDDQCRGVTMWWSPQFDAEWCRVLPLAPFETTNYDMRNYSLLVDRANTTATYTIEPSDLDALDVVSLSRMCVLGAPAFCAAVVCWRATSSGDHRTDGPAHQHYWQYAEKLYYRIKRHCPAALQKSLRLVGEYFNHHSDIASMKGF